MAIRLPLMMVGDRNFVCLAGVSWLFLSLRSHSEGNWSRLDMGRHKWGSQLTRWMRQLAQNCSR